MANSSRTMREDLPDTAVTEARPREERLETLAQQIGGRSPVRTGPSSVDAFHRDAAAHQLDQWAAIARLGRLPWFRVVVSA
jgi:hypothetical protein